MTYKALTARTLRFATLLPLCVSCALSDESESPDIDGLQQARLSLSNGQYTLLIRGESYPVDRDLLIPPSTDESQLVGGISSFEYSEDVTLFSINDHYTAAHISSYDIQMEGSGQGALGRDLLLVNRKSKSDFSLALDLGISKQRGRQAGCWFALFHQLEIGDVNGDGSMDVQVTKKEIACRSTYDEQEEVDRLEQRPIVEEAHWYEFAESAVNFIRRSEPVGSKVTSTRQLPLIGLKMDPVTYVNSLNTSEAKVEDSYQR